MTDVPESVAIAGLDFEKPHVVRGIESKDWYDKVVDKLVYN